MCAYFIEEIQVQMYPILEIISCTDGWWRQTALRVTGAVATLSRNSLHPSYHCLRVLENRELPQLLSFNETTDKNGCIALALADDVSFFCISSAFGRSYRRNEQYRARNGRQRVDE